MSNNVLTILTEHEYKTSPYPIDVLCQLIFEIINLHREFSKKLLSLNRFNFKKTLVRDIVKMVDDSETYIIDNDFHIFLNDYLMHLDQLTVDIDLEYTYSEFDFRLRVKQTESIIYKIGHYFSGKQENGRIPLNKCLNDLLGFRIILPEFKHECSLFKKMCEFIEDTYRIKYINSSKGNYNATHVYFLGESNKNFPWELQIWLPNDYHNNYESHAKHKQEYLKSAKIHKQALDI